MSATLLRFQHPAFAPLLRRWSLWVEPAASVQDAAVRHQTRVVLSLLFTFIVFTVIATAAIFLMWLNGSRVDFHIIGSLLLLVEIGSFILTRTGRIAWAITLLCVGVSIVMAVSATWYTGDMGVKKLYAFIVIGIIGAFFLPAKSFILVSIVQFLMLFFAPLYIREATFEQINIGPLQTFVLVTVIHALVMHHRRHLEQRLVQSQDDYRYLVDNINDIVTVTDLNGEILRLNRAARQFYDPEIFSSAQPPPSTNLLDYVLPDDLPVLHQAVEALMQHGQTDTYRLRVRNLHGETRWMECRSTANMRDGQRVSTTTVSRDVTERRLHEERLRASEAQLRFLTERLASYAYRITIDQRTGDLTYGLIAGSREEVIGYRDDELPDIAQVYAPAYKQAAYDTWFDVLRGEPRTLEAQVIRKDGHERWLRVHYFPLREEGTLSVITAAQDITEQKAQAARQLQAEVEHARLQVVSNIVQAISHDFRTHLATAQTSSYLLTRMIAPFVEEAGKTDQVQEKLNTIHASVQHLTEQLDNLKMITMLVEPSLTPCLLTSVLENLYHQFTPVAQEHQHQLTLHIPSGDTLAILADADELSRALRELILNALTHTPAGGHISVEARRKADQIVEVQIVDEGGGIAEEHRAHIFDLFYRSDEARSTDQGGMGVGLSIARMIVEAFNGTIEVSSEVGKGSTFTLRFPAAP